MGDLQHWGIAPEDHGDYFSWGEICTKSKYTKRSYKSKNISNLNIVGDQQHDTAKAICGEGWRLPTKQDFEELLSVCEWTKGTTGGSMSGYYVVGPSGSSIFFPSAGFVEGETIQIGSLGCYWTGNALNKDDAFFLDFNIFEKRLSVGKRCYGYSIRPVCE